MIKLEHVVLASPEQMRFIIEGMRNPMNSWKKTDSGNGCDSGLCSAPCAFSPQWCGNTPRYVLGENDRSLMQRLSKAGTDHRKFMRMLPVYVRITAPLYWWKEFDTYKGERLLTSVVRCIKSKLRSLYWRISVASILIVLEPVLYGISLIF